MGVETRLNNFPQFKNIHYRIHKLLKNFADNVRASAPFSMSVKQEFGKLFLFYCFCSNLVKLDRVDMLELGLS